MTHKQNEIERVRKQIVQIIEELKLLKDQLVELKNQPEEKLYLVETDTEFLSFATKEEAVAASQLHNSKIPYRAFAKEESLTAYIEKQKAKKRKYEPPQAYMVHSGRMTGVVTSQQLLRFSIEGFPDASYTKIDLKDKTTNEMAPAYRTKFIQRTLYNNAKNNLKQKGYEHFFYVDGSAIIEKSIFSSGFVLERNGEVLKEQAYSFDTKLSGNNHSSLAAELQSAMLAVIEAKKSGIKKFCIVFDCLAIIEEQLNRSNTNKLCTSYYDWMKKETEGMDIEYLKATSHIGIKGNELVDELVISSNYDPKKIYAR